MKHFGDITKINGHEIPLVDIVCGGSPCQDLSVAGKRAGLDGERSGLFMEQIRIIKEMRDESARQQQLRGADFDVRNIQPRYMVWENVPGAFSSNGGEDFRVVLEETARVIEGDTNVPGSEGGWSNAGAVMGHGWSIAWRVHDAQFWGVPQRRKRISLVADFGGTSAPEILFERKGMPGHIEKSEKEGKDITGTIKDSAGEAISFLERAGCEGGGKGILIQHERTATLSTFNNQSICYGLCSYSSNSMKSSNPYSGIYKAETSRTLDLNGGNPACNQGRMIVLEENNLMPSNKEVIGNVAMPLRKKSADSDHIKTVCYSQDAYDKYSENEKSATIKQSGGIYGGGSEALCIQKVTGSMMASGYQKNGTQEAMNGMFIVQKLVRRLTPLECERLQGYPDGWTDIGEWTDSKGKKHKDADSPRYKALGNSIALPFWEWMAKRMVSHIDHPSTMASLFDGIGGFPLVFSRAGCEPIWASEIEEFPIAVTKIRFPDTAAAETSIKTE